MTNAKGNLDSESPPKLILQKQIISKFTTEYE